GAGSPAAPRRGHHQRGANRDAGRRASRPPHGIATTNVVIDPGVTVATKLQSWIGTAVRVTRFSARDVRCASALAPADGSDVRSKVKPLLAAVSPLRTTIASV